MRRSVDGWGDLAKRCFVSRDYAKKLAYEVAYGGGDPWERHIILAELPHVCFTSSAAVQFDDIHRRTI